MANNPTLLVMPLAENGTKNVIPETQVTAGDGLFSQSTGFPAETSLPLGAGGVAPSREDFNGMANLLGGVAFMAQKGFTFNYAATQDYYKGCVVIDPNDGNRYLCVADMAAGTIAPSADTTGDYWILYPVGVINKRDVITTSGTYTAPVTGWYKITVKGGGAGGQGGTYNATYGVGGVGGGEGGLTIGYDKMTAGETAVVVVGAGGTGGAKSSGGSGTLGTAGGNSRVTIRNTSYIGNGGGTSGSTFIGGSGTIPGLPGARGNGSSDVNYLGRGGYGGGSANFANSGAGGRGGDGALSSGSTEDGLNGQAGFVWIEYFDPTLI